MPFTTDSPLPLRLIAYFQEELYPSSIAIMPVCKIHAKTQGYIIKSVRLFWLLTFIHNEQNTTDVFPLPSEFIQEIDFYHV